jgi:serine phosphatase RsbU (regulator of sigma subunit)
MSRGESPGLELVNDWTPGAHPIPLRRGVRLVVGRLGDCDVWLDHPAVSRKHAVIECTDAGCSIDDFGSRHGTKVNSRPIRAGRPALLIDGDVVQLGPCLLRVRAAASRVRTEGGDASPEAVRTIVFGAKAGAEQALRVLIEVVRGLPSDGTIEHSGRMVLDRLLAVTGLERALMVRFNALRDDAEVLAQSGRSGGAISRTVLASAGDPQRVAHLSQATDIQAAVSIAGAGVREVLCARIVAEGEDHLYLYLDSVQTRSSVDSSIAEFVGAAARICGLMIESHARRRLEALRVDVERAHLVQRRLLPHDTGVAGGIGWSMRSLPGATLAGDFAGVAPRPDGSVLAWIGDVAGKGPAAAMLMATAQAWLSSSALRPDAPAAIAQGLNDFLFAHSDPEEFATLLIVLIDPTGAMTACDAGHGLVFRVSGDRASRLDAAGGPPLGLVPEATYAESEVGSLVEGRLVLATDGVHEQRNAAGSTFDFSRIEQVLEQSKGTSGDVEALIRALHDFAGSRFDDDVTVLSLERRA